MFCFRSLHIALHTVIIVGQSFARNLSNTKSNTGVRVRIQNVCLFINNKIMNIIHPCYVRAAYFASVKHTGQLRKGPNSQPYINHPLQVANYVISSGVNDPITLCAAVLHDTLEDTKTTQDEIRQEFGEEVLKIVKECSDNKSLDKVERKVQQIQHSKHVSNNAKVVKMADKLSNIGSLKQNPPKGWSQQRVKGYVVWSFQVVQHMRGVNQWLQSQLDIIFDQYGVSQLTEQEKKTSMEAYYSELGKSKEK